MKNPKNLQDKIAELESLKQEERALTEKRKEDVGIFDEKHLKKVESVVRQIASLETEISYEQNADKEQKESANALLNKTFQEYVKDKGWEPVELARFHSDVLKESKELVVDLTPEILTGLMKEREKAFAEKDKEAIEETQTVEGDEGMSLADKDKPSEEPESAFQSTIKAMASGDSNYIPPTDKESVEKFFTRLESDNKKYRQAARVEDLAEEEA